MFKNPNDVKSLNARFGRADQIRFIEGKRGFPYMRLINDQATALISIYAGQLLSFRLHDEEDLFFISDRAHYTNGKAIKGGVPVCWPWFGPAPLKEGEQSACLPDHGFVRTRYWNVQAVDIANNGDFVVTLAIETCEQTHAFWPSHIHLELQMVIGEEVAMELITRNTGDQPFVLTEALHSYFNIGDASRLSVLGLEHTEYLDKTTGYIKACQMGAVTLGEETDHIHTDIKHALTIDDPVFDRKIMISSSGNKNVVVWNPWEKGAARSADLEDDAYQHFICIEIANAVGGMTVEPGQEHRMDARYSQTAR